jgi:hypothetical protein
MARKGIDRYGPPVICRICGKEFYYDSQYVVSDLCPGCKDKAKDTRKNSMNKFDIEVKIEWGALISISGKPAIFIKDNGEERVQLPVEKIRKIIFDEYADIPPLVSDREQMALDPVGSHGTNPFVFVPNVERE